MPSPSDALKAVIEPLLKLVDPKARKLSSYQNAIDLGREAWNLHVKSELGGAGNLDAAMARASERLARDDVSPSEVRLVLQMLLDRKRTLFPGDDRVFIEAEALETDDGLQLKVTWARLERMH